MFTVYESAGSIFVQEGRTRVAHVTPGGGGRVIWYKANRITKTELRSVIAPYVEDSTKPVRM